MQYRGVPFIKVQFRILKHPADMRIQEAVGGISQHSEGTLIFISSVVLPVNQAPEYKIMSSSEKQGRSRSQEYA